MVIKYLTFEQIHNKKGVGSTRLRVHNLLKHWPEASLYKYGEKPDVMIFQKVYELADYHFIKHLDCIKILDICDADWNNFDLHVKETVDAVDAVTCSSQEMVEFIQQLTDKPVICIPDRFDIVGIPEVRKIYHPATNLVWFGYSHNAETLRTAIWSLEDSFKLDALGQQMTDIPSPYRLTIYSNQDPSVWQMATNPEKFQAKCTYKKYNPETIMEDLNKFDAAILPKGSRPIDRFKSNNRTIMAHLAGLPVVVSKEELEELADHKVRNQKAAELQQQAIRDYDCKESVREMKELIERLCGVHR